MVRYLNILGLVLIQMFAFSIFFVFGSKVELIQGYPTVLINRKRRNYLTAFYKHQPTLMATNLLKEIIPVSELKECCARGQRDSDAKASLPSEVMDAIERKFKFCIFRNRKDYFFSINALQKFSVQGNVRSMRYK